MLLPGPDDELPDDWARLLFEMSSVLPPAMRGVAAGKGYDIPDEARGVVYQADPATLIAFLDIGTRHPTEQPGLLGDGE
jgi:hypothetical protein